MKKKNALALSCYKFILLQLITVTVTAITPGGKTNTLTKNSTQKRKKFKGDGGPTGVVVVVVSAQNRESGWRT